MGLYHNLSWKILAKIINSLIFVIKIMTHLSLVFSGKRRKWQEVMVQIGEYRTL